MRGVGSPVPGFGRAICGIGSLCRCPPGALCTTFEPRGNRRGPASREGHSSDQLLCPCRAGVRAAPDLMARRRLLARPGQRRRTAADWHVRCSQAAGLLAGRLVPSGGRAGPGLVPRGKRTCLVTGRRCCTAVRALMLRCWRMALPAERSIAPDALLDGEEGTVPGGLRCSPRSTITTMRRSARWIRAMDVAWALPGMSGPRKTRRPPRLPSPSWMPGTAGDSAPNCWLSCDRARSEGIRRFTALVAADNAAMAGLARNMGADLARRESATVVYEIVLVPASDPHHAECRTGESSSQAAA